MGLLALSLIPNKPSDARFLSSQDQQWLEADISEAGQKTEHKAKMIDIFPVIRNPRVWALGIVLFANILGVNTLLFWMPQIIKQISGASNADTGLLTALPWISFAIGMLVLSWLSGGIKNRVAILCTALCISAAGFALSALSATPAFGMLGLLIGAFGIGAAQGLFWAVAMQKVNGPERATAYGVITIIGNGSGVFANVLIGWSRDLTGNFTGVVLALGAVMLAAIIMLLLLERFTREEKRPA